MNEFKPAQIIYRGDKDRGIHHLKFARKLLSNMIERNEKLGQYKNPVYQYRDKEKTIKVTALPGYDIIEIFVPLIGGEEQLKTTKLYSGMFEPRYNPASLDWYLRYWPSNYELFNADQNLDKGLGSSIDGAKVDPPMPPNRWMYNDYDTELGLTEAPWFALNSAPERWLTGLTPGQFSGQLRKLVQLQLGMGLYPQFDGKTDFIRLETLPSGKTRVWLYTVTNGVRMQLMGDYDEDRFEDDNGLKRGSIPPEFEEAGFFSYQTSFDDTRQEYTKAEYDALNPQPGLPEVTFKLMTPEDYATHIGAFEALGDYGWSFNSAGTQGTFTGITTNYPEGRNFKSQQFRMFIQEYVISIVGFGEKLFLFDSASDQIKVPNTIGELESFYFWRADDGFKGTQPSNSYTAPMYSYIGLDDVERVVSYTYTALSDFDDTPCGVWTGWADAIACRRDSYVTNHGYPSSFDYSQCTYGRCGTGADNGAHGFISDVTDAADEVYNFAGAEFFQSAGNFLGGWHASGYWLTRSTPGGPRRIMLRPYDQMVATVAGNIAANTANVIVIPSFERLAYYHFKSYSESKTEATKTWEKNWYYDGTVGRSRGDGNIGPCDPGITACPPPAGTEAQVVGSYGSVTYWGYEINISSEYETGDPIDCGVRDPGGANEPWPCWMTPGTLPNTAKPPNEDPYEEYNYSQTGGLVTPHGTLVVFSDAEINEANPFRESSENYGVQGVVSAFDTFVDRWVFSLPDVGITAIQENLNGEFTSEFSKYPVGFVGAPYYR